MIQCGPYGPNHATAGTFAFRAELLKDTRYQDDAALAEERAFLKGYTVPFVQLDPMKSILVFSHEHNTFDKRKLLDNPHPDFLKESTKTIDMFIRNKEEANIKKFFVEEIDKLLEKYEPGEPKMKPDVLKQIIEIEKDRERMISEENAKSGQIIMQQPGKEPVPLNPGQVVELIRNQQTQMESLSKTAQQLDQMNQQLQKFLIDKQQEIAKLNSEIANLKKELTSVKQPSVQTPAAIVQVNNPIIDPVFTKPAVSKSAPKFTISDPSLL
jgi:hypothetical protein